MYTYIHTNILGEQISSRFTLVLFCILVLLVSIPLISFQSGYSQSTDPLLDSLISQKQQEEGATETGSNSKAPNTSSDPILEGIIKENNNVQEAKLQGVSANTKNLFSDVSITQLGKTDFMMSATLPDELFLDFRLTLIPNVKQEITQAEEDEAKAKGIPVYNIRRSSDISDDTIKRQIKFFVPYSALPEESVKMFQQSSASPAIVSSSLSKDPHLPQGLHYDHSYNAAIIPVQTSPNTGSGSGTGQPIPHIPKEPFDTTKTAKKVITGIEGVAYEVYEYSKGVRYTMDSNGKLLRYILDKDGNIKFDIPYNKEAFEAVDGTKLTKFHKIFSKFSKFLDVVKWGNEGLLLAEELAKIEKCGRNPIVKPANQAQWDAHVKNTMDQAKADIMGQMAVKAMVEAASKSLGKTVELLFTPVTMFGDYLDSYWIETFLERARKAVGKCEMEKPPPKQPELDPIDRKPPPPETEQSEKGTTLCSYRLVTNARSPPALMGFNHPALPGGSILLQFGQTMAIPVSVGLESLSDYLHPDEDPTPHLRVKGTIMKPCPKSTLIGNVNGPETSTEGERVPTEEEQKPPTPEPKEPPKEPPKEKKKGGVNIKFISIVPRTSVSEVSKGYDPESYPAAAGSLIFWRNNDHTAHMVVSGNPSTGPTGLFNSGWIVPGRMFSIVGQQGTYEYYCALHPHMKGQLNIK